MHIQMNDMVCNIYISMNHQTTTPFSYLSAFQSFIGYLENTKKSLHTINNYRYDLTALHRYLEAQTHPSVQSITQLHMSDINSYSEYLRAKNFKTNTRRRKILTIRKFLRYLSKRNLINISISELIPVPYKLERIPHTIVLKELHAVIKSLPTDNCLQTRNKILLWTLTATGAQINEVARLQYEHFSKNTSKSCFLTIGNKKKRKVPIPNELFQTVQVLRQQFKASKQLPWIFTRFNRFGPLPTPITTRGIELLLKSYAKHLNKSHLTSRTIRHSVIMQWLHDGRSREEIKTLLGLKSMYIFRSYTIPLNP